MKPDAGEEATAVIGKVPVPWKCDGSGSSSNKWVGLNIEGLFLPALPLLSCGRGRGKDCCSDPPTSQLADCQGQGPEQ